MATILPMPVCTTAHWGTCPLGSECNEDANGNFACVKTSGGNGSGQSADVTRQWWFWLLIAVAIILVILIILVIYWVIKSKETDEILGLTGGSQYPASRPLY